MENTLRKEMEAGKKVSVTIDIGYPAAVGARPNVFSVTALIDGAKRTYIFRQ